MKQKQVFNPYYINKVKENLKSYYNKRNENEALKSRFWYDNANLFCHEVARQYDTTPKKVALVVSALSPFNKWEVNKTDAIRLIDNFKKGKTLNDFKVSTTNSNKFKAWDIMRGTKTIEENSLKTFAFYRNIFALDHQRVTIDRHHLTICFKGWKDSRIPNLTKRVYKELEKITLEVAEEFNLRGYEFLA